MTWLYRFSATEWVIIGLFVGLYGLYFFRTFRLARQLNSSALSVIPKFFLRAICLTLLLIAGLGPTFGEADRDVQTEGRDVYVLLDVSRSMDATDMSPSRLERAKFTIRQLADTLQGDRFGLILFATKPFVLTPLTNDHQAFNQLLDGIHTDMVPTTGTDLCAAIALASRKFLTDPSAEQNAKALVLVSDGEDFGLCSPLVLNQLRTVGINLFTVGIGTELGSPIREGRDFIRDDQGLIARSRLNREFLRRLARDGQGSYHEADADNRHIDGLTAALRQMQGRTINQQQIAVSTNKFYYFLLAALLFIAVDLVSVVRTFRL